MSYRVELLDPEGRVIESRSFDTPAAAEAELRRLGSKLIAFDDERFDGPGEFVAGTLRWYQTECACCADDAHLTCPTHGCDCAKVGFDRDLCRWHSRLRPFPGRCP